MSIMASQVTGVSIGYSTVCSGSNQRQYQSSTSLAFVRGIHRWPVNSPHQGPITPKRFFIWWRHHDNDKDNDNDNDSDNDNDNENNFIDM